MLGGMQCHVYHDIGSMEVVTGGEWTRWLSAMATRMGGGILPAASRTRCGVGLLGHNVCTGSQ